MTHKIIKRLKEINDEILDRRVEIKTRDGEFDLTIQHISFLRINDKGNIEFDVFLGGAIDHTMLCEYSQDRATNLTVEEALTLIKVNLYESEAVNKLTKKIMGVS